MLEGGNEREQRGGKEFFHEGVLKGEKNPHTYSRVFN